MLGISAEAMNNYSKGEYGKSDKEKRGYVDAFRQFFTVIENELETELRRDKGQVNGIIFALKNQFSNDWRDEKHIKVDERKEYKIMLVLPPDSPIAKRLAQEGVQLVSPKSENIIEHDSEAGISCKK